MTDQAARPPSDTRPETIPRVVAVTSGKGGVGKTALVANSATILARRGYQVLIFDADLGLANIDVMLGLTPQYNLNHFFAREIGLDQVLTEGAHGLQIIPAGSGVQSFLQLDGDHKLHLLESLDELPYSFDFVFIDTEAGISENVTYFTTAAHETIVVTTPDPPAITDAYALMKLLSTKYHEKRFNLVVNMVQDENEALDVYRKLSMVANRYLDIAIEFFGSIPFDRQMHDAIRRQRPIVDLYRDSATAKAFVTLVERIMAESRPVQAKGSVQFFWRQLLGSDSHLDS